jgi:hypothetical protein
MEAPIFAFGLQKIKTDNLTFHLMINKGGKERFLGKLAENRLLVINYDKNGLVETCKGPEIPNETAAVNR